MKNYFRLSSNFILLFLLVCTNLFSQWSTNPTVNNAICTATGSQTVTGIVSDGVGGFIFVWEDSRGVNKDIYAQKINSSGVIQWTIDGVAVCTVAGDQKAPSIVSDGKGGAFIAWEDRRFIDSSDIYAQKINSSGIIQWSANGTPISTAHADQFQVTGVSDGAGGAIFTWSDTRNGFSDIYAQRINAFGTLWSINGIPLCTATDNQSGPNIVADGSGGAIVAWLDWRGINFPDIYAQNINTSGVVRWAADGVAICTAPDIQMDLALTSDGFGGAIITWLDLRNGSAIYAQKINASGSTRWFSDGNVICADSSNQNSPTISSDGVGGAFIAWQDDRSGLGIYDIYAQKINELGAIQWASSGMAVCTATNSQQDVKSVSDGAGGVIVTWDDFRTGGVDIYAQKINAEGKTQWFFNGNTICSSVDDQAYPMIISDNSGGAIVTWIDYRDGKDINIYAQKIDKYGFLGQAEPKLVAAKDIANDQGGKLRLFWDPSYLDLDTSHAVTSYAILRGTKPSGVLGKMSQSNGSGIYWEEANIVKANQLEGYTTVVSTYADSGLQGVPKYYFQVIARNNDSTQTWYSNIDSGYSVDNVPPVGISGATISGGQNSMIQLHWNKDIVDPDIMGYYVYRSATPGFLPNGITLLALTHENLYTDTSKLNNQKYYYRITAVDMHGNAGPASEELQVSVLAVGNAHESIPKVFALLQNYPNPFNPSTVISYQLPVNSHVTLKVYDAIGREVVTLVNEVKEAGNYSAQFDGTKLSSGIYFATLQSGDKVQLKKMLLLK